MRAAQDYPGVAEEREPGDDDDAGPLAASIVH